MSVRLARVIAVFCLAAMSATVASGVALAVTDEWRRRVASPTVTPEATVAFVEHGRTYFAPPLVVKWHDRLTTLFLTLLFTSLSALVLAFIAVLGDTVGLRWKRR